MDVANVTATSIDEIAWPTPRAAYIHVPFCRHRCGYCNFSVIAGKDHYADRYLQALSIELKQASVPRSVDSIFIGGGTPTHLPTDWLRRLLKLVCDWYPVVPGGEFSVEANPGDITIEKLEVLASYGVNRISLGVQSFDSAKLTRLERDHDGASAEQAIELAAKMIGNVSIDLIFAAPEETLEQWQQDLDRVLSLPIAHLSTYGLTYEKGTQFWNRLSRDQSLKATEDLELAMYQSVIERCQQSGWKHYEVSNHAKPGFQCRHNMAYWEGRGWYAAGPGAASFVDGFRAVNHRSPTTYINKVLGNQSPVAESERLDRETWARERLVFGLRMIDGVDLTMIEHETCFKFPAALSDQLEYFVSEGFLERTAAIFRLSERGLYLSDSISGKLL